ncbi:Ras-like protein 2 [Erysiphe neolycopersici]|uniref:Ras-like protein 2 n=1 Tax=Erysiphe neolycopersici TaxID=212602 RepID=A0A420I174_9PEZI|nr:Ras-like protein 2 [Erysiphe neolycopersici]
MTLDRITITICGDGAAGKSSIALRLVRSEWTNVYDPTIEDTYSVTRQIDRQPYHLSIIDTAGQKKYRSLWKASNYCSDAFLLVYDITRPESLNVLEEFSKLIDQKDDTQFKDSKHSPDVENKLPSFEFKHRQRNSFYDTMEQHKVRRKPIKVLVGNMCDLQQKRLVPTQTGMRWAKKHGCSFSETSAKDIINIEEVFEMAVRQVLETRQEAICEHQLSNLIKKSTTSNHQIFTSLNTKERLESVSSSKTTLLNSTFSNYDDYDEKKEEIVFKNRKGSKVKVKDLLRFSGCGLSRDFRIRGIRPIHCF